MDIEIETKVLNINVSEIIAKLRALKAKESPEMLSRRYVFDIESDNIEWIRLRESGGKVTLTYKYKLHGNTQVGKTTEIEVEVSDFDKTALISKRLPFKRIFYQENKSHKFYFQDIEFSIDTWPLIDPYLEIESDSIERVQEELKLLGLDGKDVGDKDITEIYQEKGQDIPSYPELKF